jgi:peptidyl-prolyl cis-trans isomerase C
MAVSFSVACSEKQESSVPGDTDLSTLGDRIAASTTTTNTTRAGAQDAERVVMRINGKELKRGDFINEMELIAQSMQGRVPPERLAQMQDEIANQAMDQLVVKTLLWQESEKLETPLAEEELEEAMARFRASLPSGTVLEDQLERLGMTMEELRSNIARELRINQLLEKQVVDIEPPDEEEMKTFYEENKEQFFTQPESVRARHILVLVDEEDTEETRAEKRARVESLRERALAGEDFSELASTHSECNSAMQGGNLGVFQRGQMVPSFEEAAFSQPVGEVGEVVETRFGYHVILVDERIEEGTQSFDEAHDRIESGLFDMKRQEALRAYVTQLREEAAIELVE